MSALLVVLLAAVSGSAPRDVLSRACLHAHDADACVRMNRALERGEVEQHYREESLHYLAMACTLGAAQACADAEATAQRYPEYELVETDAGCMLEDNAYACEEVGEELLREGQVPARAWAAARLERAISLYREACTRGEATACLGRGRLLLSGEGVFKDPAGARQSLARGCELGLGRACVAAAESAPTNLAALHMLRLGCEGAQADAHACFALAQRSEAARLPVVTVRARYAKACSLAHVEACDWLEANK